MSPSETKSQSPHDFALEIGEQDIGEFEFVGKLVVRLNAVFADAHNDCVCLLELGIQLAEPASFLGSARRAVFRIEKQHNGFTLELV